MRVIGFGLGLLGVMFAAVVVLFLGGLTSAALEIRREKRAGLVPTRPAWENAAKRRALGGFAGQVRASWSKVTHSGFQTCWCGHGPLAEFPALDASDDPGKRAGIGCTAWEAGLPEAIEAHARAGGYSRVAA